jgi:hypothetical protein
MVQSKVILSCLVCVLGVVCIPMKSAQKIIQIKPTVRSEGMEALVAAIRKNKCDQGNIENFLKTGGDLDAPGKYGRTPLMWASYEGNSELSERLLKAKASVDASGIYLSTPLMEATRSVEQVAVLKKLLESKARPNSYDYFGLTALGWAVNRGNSAAVVRLLLEGAGFAAGERDGYCDVVKRHATCKGQELACGLLLYEKFRDPKVLLKTFALIREQALENSETVTVDMYQKPIADEVAPEIRKGLMAVLAKEKIKDSDLIKSAFGIGKFQ